MKNSVAVLWDAENVNPNQKEGLVEGVLEYAKKYGQISVAAAFADWKKQNLGSSDETFANESFQLIHVPSSRKNSADISLITSGMEYLFFYPHIETYVLVTGDVDFRPLVVSIRRRGCKAVIICDARNANENLLQVADEYFDYRTIIDTELDEKSESLSKEESYKLLVEAVKAIGDKKGKAHYSAVKVRMLLLDDRFSEKALGLKNWASFIELAEKEKIIKTKEDEKQIYIEIVKTNSENDKFTNMLHELAVLAESKTEKRVLFTKLNKILTDKGVDIKNFGYTGFKKYLQDAEKRDLVKIESDGRVYYVLITDKGLKHDGTAKNA